MESGWKETRLGDLARAIHEKMNVQGLALAVGKDEAKGFGSAARLVFSAPEGEELEPPAQQGADGKHICEDRVLETTIAIWGQSAGAAEVLYERLIVALRELGISRHARRFGRVRWEEGAGRAGSAGVKVIVPLAVRLPVLSIDLKKALVLGASAEMATTDPSGEKSEVM